MMKLSKLEIERTKLLLPNCEICFTGNHEHNHDYENDDDDYNDDDFYYYRKDGSKAKMSKDEIEEIKKK